MSVRARTRVDFGCLANLLPESLPALSEMAPLTPAFKCFLGGSTGLGGMIDRAEVRALFAGAARSGRMIVAHCEDEELLRQGKHGRIQGQPPGNNLSPGIPLDQQLGW